MHFRHEYVHRDLKLENIMIESKETYLVKLVDFGFAERINYKELVSKAGTPGYIPPEIFKNQPYTSKGDIFSMGVIIYSVLIFIHS
jgi:serine/threonine protein kinase